MLRLLLGHLLSFFLLRPTKYRLFSIELFILANENGYQSDAVGLYFYSFFDKKLYYLLVVKFNCKCFRG